jgi:hypothetical protein
MHVRTYLCDQEVPGVVMESEEREREKEGKEERERALIGCG